MEALILALGASEISKVVNVGTLRYFIEFTFRDMLAGTSFDLGPLWNTLAAEPGLTPEMIYPPLLQFREWQGRLGVTVTLPKPMQELPAGDLDGFLSRIQVRTAELDRILQEGEPPRPTESPSGRFIPTAAAPKSAVPQRVAPRLSERYLNPGAQAARRDEDEDDADRFAHAGKAPAKGAARRRRTPLVVAATLVIAATFGYAGSQLFGHHGKATSLASVSSILRLDSARRVDYAVTAVIDDPRWATMKAEERQRAVEAIFKVLEKDGVQSLILRGPGGESRALVSTVGGRLIVKVE